MDELDKELKQVQLQRERLALKRELARSEWRENTIDLAGRGLSYGTDALRSGAGGFAVFVKRWWMLPASLALLTASLWVGLEWKHYLDEASVKSARAKHQAQRDHCGKRPICDYPLNKINDLTCMNDQLAIDRCTSEADSDFFGKNGNGSSR